MGLGEDSLFITTIFLSIAIAILSLFWIFLLKKNFGKKMYNGFLILIFFMSVISIFKSLNIINSAWPVAYPQIISFIQLIILFILNIYLKNKSKRIV